jgi:AcrR family transcriptional regulator
MAGKRAAGTGRLEVLTGRGRVDRDGGRGELAEIQRARMVTAMVDVTRERGVGVVTVAHVVARSGVSRRTFYELFEDRDACFLAAFDETVERGASRVLPAFHAPGSWRERVRAALGAFLEFMDDEPDLGAFCVVDALGVGPAALERRARVVRALVDAVDQGRSEAKGRMRPTRLTAEGVVGAVLGVLHTRLVEGDARMAAGAPGASRGRAESRRRSMVGLQGQLMGMIVLPYHGQAAAMREIARPAPKRRRVSESHGDPLRDLDMRLTYRTVRVLLAIAELGERGSKPSNREVADAAGVQDQGQISKLLARLQHLGLIQNRDTRPLRGEPNDWSLSPLGQQVERAIRRQTAAGAGGPVHRTVHVRELEAEPPRALPSR